MNFLISFLLSISLILSSFMSSIMLVQALPIAASPVVSSSFYSSSSATTNCIATQKLKASLFDALAADLGTSFAINFARSFDEAMIVSHLGGASCLQEEIVEDLYKKLLLLYEASISVTQDTVSRDMDRVVSQLYH